VVVVVTVVVVIAVVVESSSSAANEEQRDTSLRDFPKPASLFDAVFASPCGGAGMWLLLCPRVALCEPLID